MIKKAAEYLHTFALGEYILLIDESNFSLANFLADGCLSTAAAAAVAGIVISGAKMGAYVLRTLSPSIGAFVAFIPCLSMRESMSVLGYSGLNSGLWLHRLLGVIHGINEGKILIIKQTSVM